MRDMYSNHLNYQTQRPKMQKAQISLSFLAVWLGRHSGGTRTARRAVRDPTRDMYSNQLNYQTQYPKMQKAQISLSFLAVWTGLEPATPCVTGMYSNQLNYQTIK